MYLPKESVSVEKVVCSGSRHLERIGSLWRFLDIQVSKEKLLTRITHPQPLSNGSSEYFITSQVAADVL